MNKTNELHLSLVDRSIENGIDYLLSKASNGRWRGFPTMAGESDIWVTGFIISHIETLCIQDDIINEAHNFILNARHASNGWSYSAIVPADADSTAWCLMALKSNKEFNGAELENTKSFLWNHYKDEGLSTYRQESGIGEFISAPNKEAIQGWTSSHPDVSIAAILADIKNEHVPKVLNWLISLQSKEGLIESYWWRNLYYTTTLLLRALSLRNESLPKEHSKNIIQSLIKKQMPSGGFDFDGSQNSDSFTTALALESFIHLSEMDCANEIKLCVNNLLNSQNKDGSWDGDYILRIPAPNILNPNEIGHWSKDLGGGNSFVKDKDGLFATTMACYALDFYRQYELQKINNKSSKTSKI